MELQQKLADAKRQTQEAQNAIIAANQSLADWDATVPIQDGLVGGDDPNQGPLGGPIEASGGKGAQVQMMKMKQKYLD